MPGRIRRLSLYSAILLLFLLTLSCGRKTAPVPPQAAIPAPIEDLEYRFAGNEVILEWTYPYKSINGREIEKVRRFILHKSDLAGEDYCPECPATVTSVIKIDPGSVRLGRKMKIRDPHLVPGHHYSYTVISHCGWNITSRESNRISFWWDTPPSEPTSLRVRKNEQGVKISWNAATRGIKGKTLDRPLSYQVFRRSMDGSYKLRGETTGQTMYYDQAEEGGKYAYRVRAINRYKGTAIPGPYSESIPFIPDDRTPPPIPEFVSIMHSKQGPILLWERVSAPDLAGYRVYRRLDGSRKWKVIVETGPNAFSFIDESLSDRKGSWYYAVTSIDTTSPANESLFSQEKVYRSGK